MALISRQFVLAQLAATFPDPKIAEQALVSLNSYDQKTSGPGPEAVHLAIILLSEGELWRLRELVEKARHDFRDVLYPAQSREEWSKLLSSSLSSRQVKNA
jgi:hypothetical protein